MWTLFGWLLIGACSDRAIDSADPVVVNEDTPLTPVQPDDEPLYYEPSFDNGEFLTEPLMDCDAVDPIRAHQFLCVNAGGAWLVDETLDEPIFLGEHQQVAGASTGSGALLVLDGEPHQWKDGIIEALSWSVPVPIEGMTTHGDEVWMTGVGRLFRLIDGNVREIGLAEHDTIYGFGVASDRLHLAVPHLVTLDLSGSSPGVLSVWDVPVDAMAVGVDDDLWLISEGVLYRKRGDDPPVRVDMPEPVVDVVGPTIWVQGAVDTYRFDVGSALQMALGSDGMLGVDAYGRLLQLREGQLRRHSIGRPVVVAGLSDSLLVSETVTLLPSDPSSLVRMSVWADDVALSLNDAPYQVVLDPEQLSEGGHLLRFFTESEKGDHLAEVPFWVGELEPVQWPEVEALSEAHCLRCHGGETLTDLSTAGGWELHIERIIEVVSNQDMPLGGPYLSDEDITLIRAWKQGGFQ